MNLGLQNKVAVVTGASRGIGKAVALVLAREGANVVVNYLNSESAAEQVVQEIKTSGRKAIRIQADVSDYREIIKLREKSFSEFGHVDLLVNNAGILTRSFWADMVEHDWQRMIDVNLKGAVNCIRAFAPDMLKRGQGRIVNVASIYGITGSKVPAYGAAKAGIIAITKSFAKEFAPHITVNAVAPGHIDTDLTSNSPREFVDLAVSATPLSRLGQPEEVASAVAFLLSSKADFITGHVLVIDGGFLLK